MRQEGLLSTATRRTVRSALKSANAEKSPTWFTTDRHRYESLSTFSEKVEAGRRMGAYKDALDMFSQVSLRRSGESGEYAKFVYQTLPVMMAELLAEEKRCLSLYQF